MCIILREFNLYDYDVVKRYKFLPRLSPIINFITCLSIIALVAVYVYLVIMRHNVDFVKGTIAFSVSLIILLVLFFMTIRYVVDIRVPVSFRFHKDALNIYYPILYKYRNGRPYSTDSFMIKYSDITSINCNKDYDIEIKCSSCIEEKYKLSKSGNVILSKGIEDVSDDCIIRVYLGDYSDIDTCRELISYIEDMLLIKVEYV